MKKVLLLFSLVIGFIYEANSQTFNYQSAIRDFSGNLITNQVIGVQIKLLQGSASGTVVYTETHSVTSNTYGIISLAVGTGTTTDNFNTIDWSIQNFWLETAVDITGGTAYSVVGSSQLRSVPYANYAATTGEKSSGLEQVTEGGNTGWRLIGRDHANYGDIGESAVDLSISSGASTTLGATGTYAVAMGQRATASSQNSIAIGDAVEASNNYAVAIGYGSTASGYRSFSAGENNTASSSSSTAIGNGSTATGYSSMAIGRGTIASGSHATSMGRFSVASGTNAISIGTNTAAESNNSLAVGRYNVGGGDPINWIATDALFEIGNGTDAANKTNAMTILKNGNTTLNGLLRIDSDNIGGNIGYTFPGQDGIANQIMSTDGVGNISWINAPSGADNLGNHQATQALYLSDNKLYFRNNGDTNHGIGWYGVGSQFAGINIDGPITYGYLGGALGSTNGEQKIALQWDNNQNVTISNAYSLPTADGMVNQVMRTNGSGAASWSTINELPSGGTNGQVLGVSGIGVQWLDVDEAIGAEIANINNTSVTTNALTVTNLPSFAADLSGTLTLSGAGNFFKVPTWRTNDATVTNLHDNGNHFDETTGGFTAPVDGLYFFSSQVRFDNITTGYFRLLLGVEGALSLENGLHAIKNADANSVFHTLSVSGVLKLSAGEKVFVNVTSSLDTSWSLQSESGFSGYLISRL